MSETSSAPLVGVVMGSKSDYEVMVAAVEMLREFGVAHEVRVVSAHRTPDLLFEYAETAQTRGLRAIVAGEREAKMLARHRHGRVKASAADIERALTGNWREEHLFVLGQALAMFDSLAQRIIECDAKIEALLAPLGCHEVELSGPGKRRGKNTPQFDARTALARWAGVDLTRINGLAVTHGDDDTFGDRPGFESLCQRQALLFVAGTVSWHQGQRRQGA